MPKLRTALAAAVSACVLMSAAPALAAPPPNDTVAGATVVGALPFSEGQPIDEATTDDLDALLNQQCGWSATQGSLWYRYEPTQSGTILVDSAGSHFGVGTIVTVGDPTAGNVYACGFPPFRLDVTAGETYHVLAFSYDPAVTTGTLQLSISEVLQPVMQMTVDPTGSFDPRTGRATVTGTVTCTASGTGSVYVTLRQNVGRTETIVGSGGAWVECDGTLQSWSATVYPERGKFAGGTATVFASSYVCVPFGDCAYDNDERAIRLKRG